MSLLCRFVVVLAYSVGVSEQRAVSTRQAPSYENGVEVGRVDLGAINEASGICASRRHPGVLYTHNDSGGTHRIFAISQTNARHLATIYIDGASAHDWEDIACGPCPHNSPEFCIYIADTGGNAGGDANTIYRIREPADDLINGHGQDIHVQLESKLMFSWDQHDCETIMVNNHGTVYVISKVHPGAHPKLVHLSSSLWDQGHHVYVNEGVHLPITASSNAPVAGDISPNGMEVLVKTYGHIYYFSVPDGDYYRHMQEQPSQMPYHHERQGEAVCFDSSGANYYTLGEGSHQPLYMYRRTSAVIGK